MASIYSELTESESLLVFIESGYLGIDICREFSFCSGKIKKKTDPAKCVACEMLEAEYTEYSKTQNISWSSNSQEIINDLPQQFQNELKQLIIEYPKIFEEMDYDFCSKSEICTLDLIFDAKPQSNPLINLDFIVCDAIINELIVFLNKNDKENIIQFLSSLCNYFPAQFQGSCTEIISQQKEAIVLVSLSYPNFLEKLCELLK
ncbi:saposin-like protein family [Anaeramoeba ignava]|uniref:Saposin-like protein family n=1 Tax=Anaeramoeba ignava TaxID=1746090 RepID=A0A9Q0LDU7_ANAIG|nr:saposin-like protein family [Anaeramoeba ignava]